MLSLYENKPSSSFRMTKRLLGRILVDGGFVTPGDLESAIERQKTTNGQLGEILVGMGVLNPVALKAVLSIQKDLASLEDAVKVGAGVHMLLGELLVKAKKLTQEQLDLVLREQDRTGKKIGELLIHHGLLFENELETVLAFQRIQRNEAPGSEKLRLGELLVATGQITRAQLEDVLKRQKLSKKKIGELLVEAGYVQPHQIDHGLMLQQKLVTAALIAALSMSNLFGAAEAYSANPAFSAKISITARVLEHTSMDIISQAQELIVTNADIWRGYVDAPLASRLNVRSNNPAGYLLAFEAMDGPDSLFKSVQVLMGGREVQLAPTGGWIPQPYIRGGAMMDISYRFALSKNARPGTYTWPLTISVQPR